MVGRTVVVAQPTEMTAKTTVVTSRKTELIFFMPGVPRFSGQNPSWFRQHDETVRNNHCSVCR